MKREDLLKDYYEFTGKASDLTRQLAFAVLAVVWIFKTDTAGLPVVPRALIPPTALAILALALDWWQYLWPSLAFGLYHRHLEKQGIAADVAVRLPRVVNWPTIVCFWGKNLLIFIAYGFLLLFFWRRYWP